MSLDNKRLLLLLEKTLRDTNRSVINNEIEKLSISDLKPVLKLVARCRAEYLKNLFIIAAECPDTLPTTERINTLREHRLRYEEMISASKALETAIERDYMVVSTED